MEEKKVTSPAVIAMTDDEALNLLDQAASLAQLSRADHIRVQMAVARLRRLIEQEHSVQPDKSCKQG